MNNFSVVLVVMLEALFISTATTAAAGLLLLLLGINFETAVTLVVMLDALFMDDDGDDDAAASLSLLLLEIIFKTTAALVVMLEALLMDTATAAGAVATVVRNNFQNCCDVCYGIGCTAAVCGMGHAVHVVEVEGGSCKKSDKITKCQITTALLD